jgi:hypothetical protein
MRLDLNDQINLHKTYCDSVYKLRLKPCFEYC